MIWASLSGGVFQMAGTILFTDENCVQKMAILIQDCPVFEWSLYY
jgi:hypothetical protein